MPKNTKLVRRLDDLDEKPPTELGRELDRRQIRSGRLAEVTDFSLSYVSKIKWGRRPATPEFRRRASIALDVPEAQLFPETVDAEQVAS